MRQYFILVFLLSGAVLYGQKDATAEPYLDKIAADLAPGSALYINFDYIREDQQSKTKLEGNGSLVLMGDKYRMDIDEATIYFDGTKQYSLNKEVEEVYVSIPDPENKEFMFSDPIRLLRSYKDEFKYRLMGEAVMKGTPAMEVQLYPEELGGPYALIKLFFTQDNSSLKAIVIRHKEGIVYTMNVTELTKKADPGENYFRFTATDYPNVDIIELLD